jgi:hypothetical protein
MNQTFDEELKNLQDLIAFKGYRRNGCVLYAKYDFFKPECSISELVWGFCRNPCYARRLARVLYDSIPDYTETLGKANRTLCRSSLKPSFDEAMAVVCRPGNKENIAFSTQGTSPFDMDGVLNLDPVQVFNATDEDGQLWHGLVVPPEWEDEVSHIAVNIYADNWRELWTQVFSSKTSIAKRIRQRNDVRVFHPFQHPLPLLDLNIRLTLVINYKPGCTLLPGQVQQVFGICSNDFLRWLSDSSLEIGLSKKQVAHINIGSNSIEFVSKASVNNEV